MLWANYISNNNISLSETVKEVNVRDPNNTDRVGIGRGRGRRERRGVPLDVVLGDGAAAVAAVVLQDVAVVRRREHHGRLVRLRVLMVEVDHASAAVRPCRHAVEERERGDGLQNRCRKDE